jgi:hypothetical protein
MFGGGVGWLNKGNGVVSGEFPSGVLYIGFGFRPATQPAFVISLELSHISAFKGVDPGAGLNSVFLRTGVQF